MNLQKKNKTSIWESFRVWKIFKNQMMVPEIINLHAPAPILHLSTTPFVGRLLT